MRTALPILVSAAALAACGSSSLTAQSSCQDFIDASGAAQDAAVSELAKELNAPAATTPLGRPNINALCASAPQKKLGEAINAMGSSGGDVTEPAETEDDAAEQATESETPEVSPEPISLPRAYVWHAKANGSSADITLGLGEPARADDPSVLGQFAPLLSVCEVDPERDAVIPMSLTVANTTKDFDVDYEINISIAQGKTMAISVASQFAEGGVCKEPYSGSPPGVSFSGVAPDDSASHDWLIVVTGFYSPAHPDGNSKELARFGGNLLISSKDGVLGTGCRAVTSDFGFALYDPKAPADGKDYDTSC